MKELFKKVSKNEWWFVTLITVLVVVIVFLPFVFGILNTPPGYYFTGFYLGETWDTGTYYAFIEQVRQGHFLFKNIFTSESQPRNFFNPFWLTIGLTAKIFNLSTPIVYQLFRFILIVIFCFLLYLFLAFFLESRIYRKVTFILILFSNGLFFSFLFIKKIFLSKFIEGTVFNSLTASPHHPTSLIFILAIILLMILAFKENKVKYSLLAGFLGLILFQFHPFNIPIIWSILGVYLIINFILDKKINFSWLKYYLILILISGLWAFYYFYLLSSNITFKIWAKQNILGTPNFYYAIVLGYGFLFILAILGTFLFYKQRKLLFLTTWFLVAPILIYLPVDWQRRLINGWQIPLMIFATLALVWLFKLIKNKFPKYYFIYFEIIIIILVFSSLFNLINIGSNVMVYNKGVFPYYISQEEIAAINFLKNNISEEKIIFSGFESSHFIAAFSARTIFFGHSIQTAQHQKKANQMIWFFFSPFSDSKKIEFLKNYKINYIYFTDREKKIGNFDPENKNYLKPIFQNNEVTIYQVVD